MSEQVQGSKWIEKNAQHLEKLHDWLNTEVKIVEIDTKGKTYNGDIRELIGMLNGMLNWLCSFIEKIKRDSTQFDVKQLIDDTVLPFNKVYVDTYEESKKKGMYVATLPSDDISYKLNLLTLCNAILNLDTDKLQALHAMLCLHNEKGQSLYNWTAWGMLVDQKREEQGYKRVYARTDDSVGPWILKSGNKGGRRTRHKRSGHKRSGKRSGHKRSGHYVPKALI